MSFILLIKLSSEYAIIFEERISEAVYIIKKEIPLGKWLRNLEELICSLSRRFIKFLFTAEEKSFLDTLTPN